MPPETESVERIAIYPAWREFMAMSVGTDDAVQMLEAGWTVRRIEFSDDIEWRSPEGISGSDFRSESLDRPPLAAVEKAKVLGQLVPRDRVPVR
jgi:hypothetical protein